MRRVPVLQKISNPGTKPDAQTIKIEASMQSISNPTQDSTLAAMQSVPRWLLYKLERNPNKPEKPNRVPYYASGMRREGSLDSDADIAQLVSYKDADTALQSGQYNGLGFALGPDSNGGNWQGVDLDNVQESGLAPLASDAPGYVEVSPSDNGYHVIGYGKSFDTLGSNATNVEAYANKRFFTFTGNKFRDGQVACLSDYVGKKIKPIHSKNKKDVPLNPLQSQPATESDEVILQKAFNAANGEKIISHYNAVWNLIGHYDHSKAEASLLQMLCIYTPNNEQLERLWLNSPLGNRDKTQKRIDYRQRTIATARSIQRSEIVSNAVNSFERVDPSTNLFIDSTGELLPFGPDLMCNGVVVFPKKSRIKKYNFDQITNRPPTQWLIKKVLPKTGVAVVYGQSKAGKSFLAFDLLAHVSKGLEWFDHRVMRAPVVYTPFEGFGGLPNRFNAFKEELFKPDIKIVEAPIDLNNQVDYDELIDVIGDDIQGGVVCIDTLAASSPALDENNGVDMKLLIDKCQRMARDFQCLVLLVHHSGKDQSRGLRGFSGLEGACDAIIHVQRNENNRHWKLEKNKEGMDGREYPFKLQPVLLGHDNDDETIYSCVVQPVASENDADAQIDHSKVDAEVLAVITQIINHKNKCTKDDVEKAGQSMPSKPARKAIRKSWETLVREKKIKIVNNGKAHEFELVGSNIFQPTPT